MSNRTQEQDGAMPEALAAILSEPGWSMAPFLWGTTYARCRVLTVYFDEDGRFRHASFDGKANASDLLDAAFLMRRIEAALAAAPDQEGR